MRPSVLIVPFCLVCLVHSTSAEPWRRHIIDGGSRGADGVRAADVNGDGLLDLATGWEEGGQIRVYLNPGPQAANKPWPAVTVGQVRSPEDAVFADLDSDGRTDVVSSCEGGQRTLFVHWAPAEARQLLSPGAWRTESIPATEKRQMWMFALPMQVDGRHGLDLVVGSKREGAAVSWLQAPADGRDLAGWRLYPLYQGGWIMSLAPHDMDGDGDDDVVVSDRREKNRGVWWLEHPGQDAAATGVAWRAHPIGGQRWEVMFLDLADLDGDKHTDIVCSTRNGHVLYLRRTGEAPDSWEEHTIQNPSGVAGGKGIKAGDINRDGRLDLVWTAELGTDRTHPGVAWLSYRHHPTDPQWEAHNISGDRGLKFDLIQLLDLDSDGDLDVLTCEERDNLGVIWYENPS